MTMCLLILPQKAYVESKSSNNKPKYDYGQAADKVIFEIARGKYENEYSNYD